MKVIKAIIKAIIICIAVIIIGFTLILPLYTECAVYFRKKAFLAQYEFEDFSQFKSINIFKRGGEKEKQFLVMDVSYHVNDSLKTGYYIVTLDRKNYHIQKTDWVIENPVEADTLRLQQLAQTFMKYKIPRLDVDTAGNAYIYIKNLETLAFVRFANENEMLKQSEKMQWIKVKENWYKCQY